MKRKIALLIALLAASAMMLTACGENKEEGKTEQTTTATQSTAKDAQSKEGASSKNDSSSKADSSSDSKTKMTAAPLPQTASRLTTALSTSSRTGNSPPKARTEKVSSHSRPSNLSRERAAPTAARLRPPRVKALILTSRWTSTSFPLFLNNGKTLETSGSVRQFDTDMLLWVY